jgi:putative colanic acid biosynthesis acetyltransferase WcaF
VKTDLSKYDNSWYHPGGSFLKRILWYFINHLVFTSGLFPISNLKVVLLRLFGAKIGKGVNIKPKVSIKYPWNLEVGNFAWIGEAVWIDNLVKVSIGANCCLSQGAMLLTGNHNYKKSTFDLMVGEIILKDGVWIGAKAIVCPGISCQSYSILYVGSVATSDLESNGIYQGNPAKKVKHRIIEA